MGMIEVGSIYYKQGGDFLLTAGNFKIEQGEKVAVLGENGSGKKYVDASNDRRNW